MINPQVTKLVNVTDLKSVGYGLAGSIPALRTISDKRKCHVIRNKCNGNADKLMIIAIIMNKSKHVPRETFNAAYKAVSRGALAIKKSPLG